MLLLMLCWFSLAILFVIDFVEGTPQYEAEAESRFLTDVVKRLDPTGCYRRICG
ncbi:unnamed protein product [Tenebrio molitor]|nr:unnamed protein product [Tenebrio molitor]